MYSTCIGMYYDSCIVHVLVCTMIAVYIGREPKSPASSIGSNDTMDLDDYDTAEEKDREM